MYTVRDAGHQTQSIADRVILTVTPVNFTHYKTQLMERKVLPCDKDGTLTSAGQAVYDDNTITTFAARLGKGDTDE